MKAQFFIVLVVCTAGACAGIAQTSQPGAEERTLVGDWQGDSICMVRESACRDEKALYHVKKSDQPGRFLIQADKIVEGKPVNIGSIDCTYSTQSHVLSCDFEKGKLSLKLQGVHLEGSMNLSDGTLWRNITLQKAP
jgi:hypothetical protein